MRTKSVTACSLGSARSLCWRMNYPNQQPRYYNLIKFTYLWAFMLEGIAAAPADRGC
jgi:hypothetical protein